MKQALLVLDLINDIVHENGNVGKNGFYVQAYKKNIISNTAKVIEYCRKHTIPIIYLVVGFSPGYPEWNENLKLFKRVKEENQIILGSWSTQIHESIKPRKNEIVIYKNRIDPFFQTNLDLLLKTANVDTLLLAGISTEFVILSAAISGHDRNYNVKVLLECTSSSDQYSHDYAIHIIKKVADIINISDLIDNGSN